MRPLPLVVLPLVWLLAACPTRELECRVGADCASGACRSDGTCSALSADSGNGDGGVLDAGQDGGADAGQSVLDGGTPDGGASDGGLPLSCAPNHDGTVTRAEVPMGAGLHATFRVGKNATLSTLGVAGVDGGREWDFSGALAGDQSVLVETRSLEGAWFQGDFPGATYFAPLSAGSELLGVFETTPDALLLRGVVSPTGGLTSTKLTYSPPAKILAFPLSRGSAFQSTSTVSGTASGLPAYYSEEYSSASDQVGELKTPFGQFPVQRVRVLLTRSGLTLNRSHLFVTECFGTVATVVSQTGEGQVDFTSASEVRRLTP